MHRTHWKNIKLLKHASQKKEKNNKKINNVKFRRLSFSALSKRRLNFQLENGEATRKDINSYAKDLVEIKLTITQHFIWKVDIFLPNIICNKCLTDLYNFAGIIHRWK